MTEKICTNKACRKIIVKDWERWLVENPNATWLQCPYCYELERIKR